MIFIVIFTGDSNTSEAYKSSKYYNLFFPNNLSHSFTLSVLAVSQGYNNESQLPSMGLSLN